MLQTDLATAHQSSSRFRVSEAPLQSASDFTADTGEMRQPTARRRLPGGGPTPGPADFKLPQLQAGLGLDTVDRTAEQHQQPQSGQR